jgi:membrane protease YdiL (CAAX protease family)
VEHTWPAPATPPPGWFPDPYGGPNLRYWDGSRWTPLQAAAEQPAREEFRTLPIAAAILALVVTAASLIASKFAVEALADRYDFPIAVFVLIAAVIGYGPLVLCARFVVNRWGTGSIRDDLGFRFKVLDIGWGPLTWLCCMAAQFAVAVVIYALNIPIKSNTEGVSRFTGDRTYVISFAILAVVAAPLVEELAFRGMVLRGLRSQLSTWLSVALQGVLFGAAHIDPIRGVGNVGLVMVLSAVGIVLGGAAYLFRRLGPTIISHALTNTIALIFILSR